MADILSNIAFFAILIALASVAFDIFTYKSRQDKWERDHPGQVYIRNYRKLTKR